MFITRCADPHEIPDEVITIEAFKNALAESKEAEWRQESDTVSIKGIPEHGKWGQMMEGIGLHAEAGYLYLTCMAWGGIAVHAEDNPEIRRIARDAAVRLNVFCHDFP